MNVEIIKRVSDALRLPMEEARALVNAKGVFTISVADLLSEETDDPLAENPPRWATASIASGGGNTNHAQIWNTPGSGHIIDRVVFGVHAGAAGRLEYLMYHTALTGSVGTYHIDARLGATDIGLFDGRSQSIAAPVGSPPIFYEGVAANASYFREFPNLVLGEGQGFLVRHATAGTTIYVGILFRYRRA